MRPFGEQGEFATRCAMCGQERSFLGLDRKCPGPPALRSPVAGKTVVVLAGSHQQFRDYCRQNGIGPEVRAIFINSREKAQSIADLCDEKTLFVYAGGWNQLPLVIVDQFMAMERRVALARKR